MRTLIISFRYWSIRIFYLITALFILAAGYVNTFPQITIENKVFKNPFFYVVQGVPDWIYGVLYFIALFISGIIFIFIMILISNKLKKTKENIYSKYMELFVNNLYNYFFSLEKYSDIEKATKLKQLKKATNTDYSKRLLINSLRRLKIQTVGISEENANRLFFASIKKQFIKAYLHSPYLRHKLFAMKTIADFGMKGFDNYIIKLTKSKNNILRNEALVTLIRLNVYDDLQFLINMNIKLNIWNINSIIQAVKQNKKHNIKYLPLINSRTPELSALGIILARTNKRNDLKQEIRMKIGDQNELVNEEAFKTYISFADNNADLEFLMSKYDLADDSARKMIIKALDKYSDKAKKISFLDNVVLKQPFTQKIEAIRVLLNTDFSAISKYKNSEDTQIRQSYLQVLDINL